MIYFDNAATSFPKAPGVKEAMAKFVEQSAANPGRSGHRLAIAAEQMIDDLRLKLVRFFDGQDPHRMVFTLNGTDALNMAIKGVLAGQRVDRKSRKYHVITTNLEHNSVSRPLVAMANHGTIDLTCIQASIEGLIDPLSIQAALKDETALVVVTHASNVLGTIQDISTIGAIVREHGSLFCVDAAQSAGVLPISIQAMAIDLLAFPGHKGLLGPTGTGGLYVGERCPSPASIVTEGMGLQAWREGGTGGDSSSPTQPIIFPYFLEGGTPNTVGLAGLSASVDYLMSLPPLAALTHEQAMIQMLIERFANDYRFILYGNLEAARHVGTLALNIQGYDAQEVGVILDESFDMAVRCGLHCAPGVHRQQGTIPNGMVRVSPGLFNTQEELASLMGALDQIAGH